MQSRRPTESPLLKIAPLVLITYNVIIIVVITGFENKISVVKDDINMLTCMNWMVMADLPTPPPPTTTILYLFWFILFTTTTSTSSSTTPPALLLLLDSSCQAKVRVGATGA